MLWQDRSLLLYVQFVILVVIEPLKGIRSSEVTKTECSALLDFPLIMSFRNGIIMAVDMHPCRLQSSLLGREFFLFSLEYVGCLRFVISNPYRFK